MASSSYHIVKPWHVILFWVFFPVVLFLGFLGSLASWTFGLKALAFLFTGAPSFHGITFPDGAVPTWDEGLAGLGCTFVAFGAALLIAWKGKTAAWGEALLASSQSYTASEDDFGIEGGGSGRVKTSEIDLDSL